MRQLGIFVRQNIIIDKYLIAFHFAQLNQLMKFIIKSDLSKFEQNLNC